MAALRPLHILEASRITIDPKLATPLRPEIEQQSARYKRNLYVAYGICGIPGFSGLAWQWNIEGSTRAAQKHPIGSRAFDGLRKRIMHQISKDTPKSRAAKMTGITSEIDWSIQCCGDSIHEIYEALLKSICIQMWTCLEVLIEDLHDAAMEAHPGLFTPSAWDRHEKWKKDLRGGFGFRSRPRFQESYSAIFSDSIIDTILTHRDLNALVAVRNLLVHRSGIVDGDFVKKDLSQAPQLITLFPTLSYDKALELNGVCTRQMVDAAIQQGYNLLREVDRWLCSKLPPTTPAP